MMGRPTFADGVYLVTDIVLCGELGVVDTVRAAVAAVSGCSRFSTRRPVTQTFMFLSYARHVPSATRRCSW